jgi:hypothetical protein
VTIQSIINPGGRLLLVGFLKKTQGKIAGKTIFRYFPASGGISVKAFGMVYV